MQKASFVLGLVLLIIPLSDQAKGICVSVPITVSEIKGRVQTQRDEAIPQTTVELWKRKGGEERGTLVRNIIVDKNGAFEILDVEKGRYLLIFKNKYFSDWWQPVRLKSTSKNKGKRLVVFLAPDFADPCSEGGAVLR